MVGAVFSVCGVWPIRVYWSYTSTSYLQLWPIIGQIFAIDMGVPHFNAPAGGDPLRISG